jgi:hypothetical protein
MRVLVVARTRMRGDRVCVGGLDTESGASARLLGHDERNLHEDHPVRPGQIRDIVCTPRKVLRPPHIEDVVVTGGKRRTEVADLGRAIADLVDPWTCNLDEIFDGRLDVTDAGTGYLGEGRPQPGCSTGFWTGRSVLRQSKFQESGRAYWIPSGNLIRKVKYVGMDDPIALIPEGVLVRFSLARWLAFPPGVEEERCYLQLSGWYL